MSDNTAKSIQETITFLKAEIVTATGPIKAEYEGALTNAVRKLSKLMSEDIKPAASVANYAQAQNIKSIENGLQNIPEFTGSHITECDSFLDRLQQIFTVTVTDVDPNLENHFLKSIKLKVSQPIYKHMISSKEPIVSFSKYKEFIRLNYGGKLSAVQTMSKIFDVPFNPDEQFHVYATSVTEYIRTGFSAVNMQHKRINKCDTDISAEDLAHFFGALLLSNNIKTNFFELHRDMVRDLDNVLNAQQVAARGEYYRDRIGTQSTSATYWGRSDKNGNRNKKWSGNGSDYNSKNGNKYDDNNRRNWDDNDRRYWDDNKRDDYRPDNRRQENRNDNRSDNQRFDARRADNNRADNRKHDNRRSGNDNRQQHRNGTDKPVAKNNTDEPVNKNPTVQHDKPNAATHAVHHTFTEDTLHDDNKMNSVFAANSPFQ